jgi:hypothetical protein
VFRFLRHRNYNIISFIVSSHCICAHLSGSNRGPPQKLTGVIKKNSGGGKLKYDIFNML